MKVKGYKHKSAFGGYYSILEAYTERKRFSWDLTTTVYRTKGSAKQAANRLAKKLGLEIEWED